MEDSYIFNYTLEQLETLCGKPESDIGELSLNFIIDLFWTRFSREGGCNV